MANNAPRLISLFSGCGGLDLGFEKAGFKRVWANDFDADATAVYSLNLGEIDGRDILNISVDEIPDGDILTAGFPCQPFSNAGNRKGIHDSRGMLYKECLRIIECKMPKVIVFENVKGLQSTKYIDGRNLADVIIEDLNTVGGVGYNVAYELLNAADYGVPQNRQRVFFVGIRKDLGQNFIFPAKQSKDNLSLRNVLDMPQGLPNHVDWPLSPQSFEMITYIPEGGSWKDVPYEKLAPRFQRIRDNMQKYRSPNFYRRFSRDEISGTITASAQPENCGIVHPTENRRYTIREIARIQTFPDDFLFIDDSPRNITAMYKVIGNAVPVTLAQCIAEAIMKQVFDECRTKPAGKKEAGHFTQERMVAAMPMNTDKAYLLGLIIGGGVFGNAEDSFRIRLPYKKWGSYLENPQRAGQISRDIMNVVSPMFRSTYGLIVSFEATANIWNIICEGDTTNLKDDLHNYGITCNGEVRANADINRICAELVDDNLKRRFVAGLADSIGSMAKSQRRFTNDNQILSLEIKGHNFNFVCKLCHLLHSINCIPDQVNWNHPNMHCASDPYYSNWRKGFKLRILLDQYARFGAFAFRTKAESRDENLSLQQHTNTAEPCLQQRMNVTPSCVHPAENDPLLPTEIRGGHYIHYRHFCAVLGCEHAPTDELLSHFSRLGELIIPFAILCKGEISRIDAIIAGDPLLAQREYYDINVSISWLLEQFDSDSNALLYGTGCDNGYPIKEVLQGAAYIIANDNELFGKRPKGYLEILKRHADNDPDKNVMFRKPDLLTPLVITGNGRGVLVAPTNPSVYARLVTISPDNRFKLNVRPIAEEDLRNA